MEQSAWRNLPNTRHHDMRVSSDFSLLLRMDSVDLESYFKQLYKHKQTIFWGIYLR